MPRTLKSDTGGKGGVSFEEAAVNLDDLEAQGFFADVTDDMRRAAHAEFTRIWAKRRPPEVWPGSVGVEPARPAAPVQADLFGVAA